MTQRRTSWVPGAKCKCLPDVVYIGGPPVHDSLEAPRIHCFFGRVPLAPILPTLVVPAAIHSVEVGEPVVVAESHGGHPGSDVGERRELVFRVRLPNCLPSIGGLRSNASKAVGEMREG